MNAKAAKMNMYDTRFSNPHGLQNAMNYSSAYDIAKLSVYAFKNKFLKNIVSLMEYEYAVYHDDNLRQYSIKTW